MDEKTEVQRSNFPKGHTAYKWQTWDSNPRKTEMVKQTEDRWKEGWEEGLSFLFPTGSENYVQLQEDNYKPAWKLLRLTGAF